MYQYQHRAALLQNVYFQMRNAPPYVVKLLIETGKANALWLAPY